MKFEKTRVLTNCAAASCGRIEFQARFGSSQSAANAGVVKVANRHRKSVRRVVWFGNRGKRKQHPHHFLDLMFFGVAIAGDRLFDQPGEYSPISSDAASAASRATPRTCPSFNVTFGL